MNAIDLLITDHREAIELIDKLEQADVDQLETADENTTPVQTLATTFNKLKNALIVHTQIEEEIFYPALEEFDETRSIIASFYDEHQKVDQILTETSELSPTDDDWILRIGELRQNLSLHINKEEGTLFPKAHELLGDKKLQELHGQMEELKNTRPASKSVRQG